MTLDRVVSDWLGPDRESHRRALFLGAGFTRACWQDAPTFEELRPAVVRALEIAADKDPVLATTLDAVNARGDADVQDLVELLDGTELGRQAVARATMSEPTSWCAWPPEPPWTPSQRPRREGSTFRPLADWLELVREEAPSHLDVLNPAGACILLGQLVNQGIIHTVVSTNWDCYVELGCALAGAMVVDGSTAAAGIDSARSPALQVFESDEDATRMTRLGPRHPVLFKVHGGVRTISECLTDEKASYSGTRLRLRSSMMVSTSDLVHWRESLRWVQEAVGDTLRSHSVITIGQSGRDPVVYRAFRERIREWEDVGDTASDRPPLAAIAYQAELRLANMVHHSRENAHRHAMVVDNTDVALMAMLAGWLGRVLAGAARRARRAKYAAKWIEDRLADERRTRVANTLTRLLALSILPGSRWAAIALRRPPFDGADEPPTRWAVPPWFGVPGMSDPLDDHLLEILGFCHCVLTRGEVLAVDEWTGTVHLREDHPLCKTIGAPLLLPLAMPWPTTNAWHAVLPQHLRDGFGWGPGRQLRALGRAPLAVVPIPGHQRADGVRRAIWAVGPVQATEPTELPRSWVAGEDHA